MKGIPIMCASEVIGQASIERQGMQYLLRCRLDSRAGQLPELELRSQLGTVRCGKCIPGEGAAVLTKRVPIKQWDAENGTISVRMDAEKHTITRVQNLRFAVFDPKTGTVQVKTDPATPIQQGSDQSP